MMIDESKIKRRSGIKISKTTLGICMNDKCYNERRHCSKYCQECSDKHEKSNMDNDNN